MTSVSCFSTGVDKRLQNPSLNRCSRSAVLRVPLVPLFHMWSHLHVLKLFRVCWSDVNDVICHVRELTHGRTGWPTLLGLQTGSRTRAAAQLLYSSVGPKVQMLLRCREQKGPSQCGWQMKILWGEFVQNWAGRSVSANLKRRYCVYLILEPQKKGFLTMTLLISLFFVRQRHPECSCKWITECKSLNYCLIYNHFTVS